LHWAVTLCRFAAISAPQNLAQKIRKGSAKIKPAKISLVWRYFSPANKNQKKLLFAKKLNCKARGKNTIRATVSFAARFFIRFDWQSVVRFRKFSGGKTMFNLRNILNNNLRGGGG
jgi:hypothetical protein